MSLFLTCGFDISGSRRALKMIDMSMERSRRDLSIDMSIIFGLLLDPEISSSKVYRAQLSVDENFIRKPPIHKHDISGSRYATKMIDISMERSRWDLFIGMSIIFFPCLDPEISPTKTSSTLRVKDPVWLRSFLKNN